MLNDRDDKSEDDLPETPKSGDDTEYHFSDDDISYEVEPEATHSGESSRPRDLKGSLVGRLNKSRRLIISLVVFLLLVYVVYKIVVPSTPTPTDTITPAAPVTTAMPVQTAAPVTPRPQPTVPSPTQPVTPVPTPPPQTPVVDMTQPQLSPPMTQPTPPSVAPPQVAVTVPSSPQPTTALPPTNQVTTPPATATQPQQLPVTPQQIIASMPSVIPVQSAAQSQPTTYPPPQTIPPPTGAVTTASTVQQEQMLAQLHAEYVQRINEFNSQNKNLQDDVQALSSRVASMEAQMNQLIQTITRQQQAPPTPPPTAKIEPPPPSMPAIATTRVPYTLQAIIPGRAWLRSDNGETVTVAEGDIVKGLGRITRIDPYDGIVEINTGTKVISLSYGSGG